MSRMIIAVDPHKASVTIEVVDGDGKVAATGRFGTDERSYRNLLRYTRRWPHRVWAVEGAQGAGRPLTQRLLADGERVRDVPAKLTARVRVLDTGQGRKTDPVDAHSVGAVALRTPGLRELATKDGELVALRLLADRRDELSRTRVQVVNRLHRLLTELIGGGAKKDLTAAKAKALLAGVRPRDVAGATRRRIAADLLADLTAVGRRETQGPQGRTARRRHSARVEPDGSVRDGPGRGRSGTRRRRDHHPVPDQGPLRRLDRHRTAGRLQRSADPPPAVPGR